MGGEEFQPALIILDLFRRQIYVFPRRVFEEKKFMTRFNLKRITLCHETGVWERGGARSSGYDDPKRAEQLDGVDVEGGKGCFLSMKFGSVWKSTLNPLNFLAVLANLKKIYFRLIVS